MSLMISVPGKTFLAGEYLALKGGPTLVCLSEPRFQLEVKKGSGVIEGLHPHSPAGLLWTRYSDHFRQFDIKFSDAYQGKGGFGASTAQFLSVYALWLFKETHQLDMEKTIDLKHLLESYYEVAWDGVGYRPSGADLIGQLKGSLTFFDKSSGIISTKNWSFDDLQFYLIHTGNKIATHEHLKTLSDFNSSDLMEAFHEVRESFDVNQSELFVSGIKKYADVLNFLGFTCEETKSLLLDIRGLAGVVAAKGCGALGADVVFVVTKKDQGQAVLDYCKLKKLSVISNQDQISSGIQIRGQL